MDDRDPVRVSPGDHVLGDPDAVLRIVVYADVTSPSSGQVYAAVRAAQRRHPCFALALRHLLEADDLSSRRAAAAAEAAAVSGRFWDVVDRIVPVGSDPSALREHCRDLGVDEDWLVDFVVGDLVSARLVADFRLAQACGVAEAPAVFVNGIPWRGADDHLLADLTTLAHRTEHLWATPVDESTVGRTEHDSTDIREGADACQRIRRTSWTDIGTLPR